LVFLVYSLNIDFEISNNNHYNLLNINNNLLVISFMFYLAMMKFTVMGEIVGEIVSIYLNVPGDPFLKCLKTLLR